MINHSDRVSHIVEQAESIAKEFSHNIHSLYLIGSAATHPESARDVDLVVFSRAPEPLKKIMAVKFLELSQLYHFKVDSVCSEPLDENHLPSLFEARFRMHLSIWDHGRLLFGTPLQLKPIGDELLWAYRWWCLYADLFNHSQPELTPIIQAQAMIVRGEMDLSYARSKQAMLAQWQKAQKDSLGPQDLLESLSSTYAKFESISALNHVEIPLFSPYWLKGLEAYTAWLRREIGDKSGQGLLRVGLEFSYFDKYVVEVLKGC